MSRVFLAEEHALGRRVVVKVLSPELAHALSAERFAREIRLSARLQHPNIVPVLTAGTTDELPYYTMPFIDGESLRARVDRLEAGQRIPLGEAVDILRDVARALAYAHGLGIVHRDIKPDNVLLAYDAAVVADFGVAKAMAAARTQDGASRLVTLTQGGVALGTPAYMAPEQAAGDPEVDHRADVYAWGVVAYEVIAGTHPFADRRSVQAMVAAHLVEHPRPLGEVAPRVPATVSALVMRCLAKDPAARPATARELADALPMGLAEAPDTAADRDALGTGVSAAGRDVETDEPAGPAPRRRQRRWMVLAGAGAAAVLLGGAGITAYVLRGGSTPPAATPTTRARSSSPAYDVYLRGKVRLSSENREDVDAAIAAFREAEAIDSSFAPARAELARAYTIKAFYFVPDSEKKRLQEDAEVEIERALALDPNVAEGYFARGLLLWTPPRRFPHEQAAQAYRRAIALDSSLDEAHHQLALVYLHVGLLDEADAEIQKALDINPLNALARFRFGVTALYRGDYERAYAIFNSTSLDRNPVLWAFQMATALFRLGRVDEASRLIDSFLERYPDEGGAGHSVRAMMAARAGRRREAESEIARSIALGRTYGHFHHTAYNIASAYAMLGDAEQAVRYLQDAADTGFPCYPLFANDTQLDGVRKDPRFIAFMARLEREYTERKKTLLADGK